MPQYISIRAHGAQPDTDCTAAIQAACKEAAAAQATVLIPAGAYHTGSFNLLGASLHLDRGAKLIGSGNIADYPCTGYNHNEMGDVRSLIWCQDADGVTLSGEGEIDLNGRAFYDFDRRNMPHARMPFTDEQVAECTAHYDVRPNQPIFFLRCKRVTVRDLRITDAPCWTMSFVSCKDVRVLDLSIENDLRIPNCDGMHFSCCQDVSVRGCHISAGDDCFAATCITDWNEPCERITVSDCVFRSASKAISIGYMHSIVRDITVSNCVVHESNRPVVIMSCAGTGLVEHILLNNLRLDSRIYAGNWWGNGEPICIMGTYHDISRYRDDVPARDHEACIRDVRIQNVSCSGENALAIAGDGGSVRDVRLENLFFERKPSKNLCLKGPSIDLAPGPQNAELPDEDGHWLYLRGAKHVKIVGATIAPYRGKTLQAFVLHCDDVQTNG